MVLFDVSAALSIESVVVIWRVVHGHWSSETSFGDFHQIWPGMSENFQSRPHLTMYHGLKESLRSFKKTFDSFHIL